MSSTVVTKKTQTALYLEPELLKVVRAAAQERREGFSTLIEGILTQIFESGAVVVPLRPQTREILEQWAEQDVRSLESLIAYILEKAAREWTPSDPP